MNIWIKRHRSFERFCNGVLDLSWPYRQRMIEAYEDFQWNIIWKFRSGGFSTFNTMWALWRAATRPDTHIAIITIPGLFIHGYGCIIEDMVKKMPRLRQAISFTGLLDVEFHNGSHLYLRGAAPSNGRGRVFDYAFIEDAAGIPDMDKYWQALFPCLHDGHAIVTSSVQTWDQNNWFCRVYERASTHLNSFNVIPVDRRECPLLRGKP